MAVTSVVVSVIAVSSCRLRVTWTRLRRRGAGCDYPTGKREHEPAGLPCGLMSVVSPPRAVGPLLRDWRQRRRMSQLDLAVDAEVSARHLSFVETGRSKPSRELVLHLAEHLDVPLRERNALLLAAGYAPVYADRPLEDDAMAPVRGRREAPGAPRPPKDPAAPRPVPRGHRRPPLGPRVGQRPGADAADRR